MEMVYEEDTAYSSIIDFFPIKRQSSFMTVLQPICDKCLQTLLFLANLMAVFEFASNNPLMTHLFLRWKQGKNFIFPVNIYLYSDDDMTRANGKTSNFSSEGERCPCPFEYRELCTLQRG